MDLIANEVVWNGIKTLESLLFVAVANQHLARFSWRLGTNKKKTIHTKFKQEEPNKKKTVNKLIECERFIAIYLTLNK